MAGAWNQAAASRPCAFCGKPVPSQLNRCPHCREEVPEVRMSGRAWKDGGREVRRGLLYMLLGGVVYYFGGGYSAMKLPISVSPVYVVHLAQMVFLGGLGLFLYGCYHRLRS